MENQSVNRRSFLKKSALTTVVGVSASIFAGITVCSGTESSDPVICTLDAKSFYDSKLGQYAHCTVTPPTNKSCPSGDAAENYKCLDESGNEIDVPCDGKLVKCYSLKP